MRLVILDIGSTLVTGPSSGPASRIARRLGLADEEKRALQHALMTTPFASPAEVAAVVGVERGTVEEVWSAQEHEAEPIQGAHKALERLAADAQLALISNIWQPYLTSVERHLGDLFAELVPRRLQLFSFREGHAKPSPAMFRRALERAGVAAGDAVMVGDSYAEDIAPAAALGMETVWVLSRPEKEAAASGRAATRTVGSIAELGGGVARARAGC